LLSAWYPARVAPDVPFVPKADILESLAGHPLATVVEDDDAGGDVFRAPEEPAGVDIFDNDREANLFAVPMSQ
jgi:hypothetical protein